MGKNVIFVSVLRMRTGSNNKNIAMRFRIGIRIRYEDWRCFLLEKIITDTG